MTWFSKYAFSALSDRFFPSSHYSSGVFRGTVDHGSELSVEWLDFLGWSIRYGLDKVFSGLISLFLIRLVHFEGSIPLWRMTVIQVQNRVKENEVIDSSFLATIYLSSATYSVTYGLFTSWSRILKKAFASFPMNVPFSWRVGWSRSLWKPGQ